jgi:hypothetical protein
MREWVEWAHSTSQSSAFCGQGQGRGRAYIAPTELLLRQKSASSQALAGLCESHNDDTMKSAGVSRWQVQAQKDQTMFRPFQF